jgi:SagB-type dehydrogenase family enzyme
MPRRSIRFRRSAAVVVYWQEGRIVLENYLTGNRITANPQTVVLLDFFKNWHTSSQFQANFSEYAPASLARALKQLVRRRLLVREDSVEALRDARLQKSWSSWLPAGGMLQFGNRNKRCESNLSAAWRRFQRRAKELPLPSPVKHYSRSPQISLPAYQKTGALPEILLARRTWRRFSKRPIQLQALATLLGLSWGVQKWVNFRGIGRLALKTSPSAGSRHPIEVYVLAVNVEGLPRGLYHYAADSHRLELLKRKATPANVVSFLGNQWWFASAAALMLMTAVFPRNQWKYRDPAAYRTVMIDSGHVCQTFCLLATWLGLAPFCTMVFDQTLVEKKLMIDGVEESLVYAAGVGTPPSGVEWAPWPRPKAWAGIAGA